MLADSLEPFRYTEAEAAMVAKLAQIRVAADGGSRKAKKQIAKVKKQLAVLQKRARRGNPIAARAAQVIEESGLLEPSQIFAMDGADPATLTPASGTLSPWRWKLWGFNVLNVGLLATAGVLAYKRKWGWAAVPAGIVALHEAKKKGWF